MQDLRPLIRRYTRLIDAEARAELENMMLREYRFPWFYYEYTTNPDIRDEDDHRELPQMVHTFVREYEATSILTERVLHLMRWGELSKQLGLPPRIFRMKANLLLQREENKVCPPHVDMDVPHKVLLYYVNDSDGDTVFYDGEGGNVFSMKSVHSERPRGGDAIVFDGSLYHSSSSPVSTRARAVINMTLTE